jgi:4-phytase/acid phosphatase
MKSRSIAATFCLVSALWLAHSCFGQSASARAAEAVDDSQLLKVIVISRHGIRAPLQNQEELSKYSIGTWPSWDVPPGNLTSHGKHTMASLGRFYAEYYGSKGFFTSDACERAAQSFAWSDVDERDISTASSFFDGLAPQCPVLVHTVERGQIDPYMHPLPAHVGHASKALAVSAVQGRIGANADSVIQANMPAFRTLDRVLGGCETVGCGGEEEKRTILYTMPATLGAAKDDDHLIEEATGPLGIASTLSEILLLEYADGKPMSQVGFGRLTSGDLTQILSLHSLYFDLANETPYIAQVQASNLMSFIVKAFHSSAVHTSLLPSASTLVKGSTQASFVFVAAHDTNLASIGGFLRANWYVQGDQQDPTLPGGGLVFELRRRRSDGSLWVRLKYVSETMDQLRNDAHLSLERPPAMVPVFIPGCSIAAVDDDCSWAAFQELVRANALPEFTSPELR